MNAQVKETEIDTETEAAASGVGGLYVTFNLGGEVMALPIANVQEIVRPADMAKVPLAPDDLLGVMALRGRMLPVSSAARLLGMEESRQDKDTRVVVLARDDGGIHGLLVDRMAGVRNIEAGDIEPPAEGKGGFVSGMARLENGDVKTVAMLLDAAKLSRSDETADKGTEKRGSGAAALTDASETAADAVADEGEMRVIFDIGNEEYSLGIHAVSEIISMNAPVAKIPHASEEIEGVTTLRGRVLSLIHGRVLFGLEHRQIEEGTKALEIEANGQRVGLIVDKVNAVMRIADAKIEDVPPILKGGRMGGLIDSICKLDDGRLVSNLNEKALMAEEAVGAAIKHAAEQQETVTGESDVDEQIEDAAKESGETMQWVVFTLNGEEYAAPGEQIREIVRVPEIVSVPQAPGFVEGAIALRGRILPVISLARRFGLETEGASEDAKIIVAEIHGVATGILVDGVRAVMDISESDQQPAPAIVAGGNNIITGLAGLDDGKRIIMLLDVDHMLNAEESEALKAVSENKAEKPKAKKKAKKAKPEDDA